jgi:hypothetical protein
VPGEPSATSSQEDGGATRDTGSTNSGATPAAEEDPAEDAVSEFDPLRRSGKAHRKWRKAGARWVAALLEEYEEAMAEVAAVFGPDADDRAGPFARSFLLEAAQVLHLHERTAGTVLDAGQALRRSFPQSWAVFLDGRVTWQEVELVWRQAQGLDPEFVSAYDAEAAALLGAVPVSRLKDRLHRLRERLQAGTAPARHTAAMQERCARVEVAADGMAWISLYTDAAEALAFDDALQKAAIAAHGVEGETRTLAQLRHDIARDLLLEGIKVPSGGGDGQRVPDRKGVQPVVYLTLPVLTALGRSTEPARLAGYGPIDLDTAKELAGTAKAWIRILTDPATGVRLAMDRKVYTPPPDLKRWLRVRDETCRAPGCNRRVATCDLDHVSGWAGNGKTEDRNLAHLCRRHHRMKGSGYWGTALHPDARMEWRSWWGGRYLTEPADQPEPMRLNDPPGAADAA